MPADGVYPCLPPLMARIAASCTLSGAGKSGCPMQKLTMSLPPRASAFTSARTTKAFSVPRDLALWLISGIGFSRRANSTVLRCGPMLVNCVAYQDGKKLADIDKRDISNYVSRRDCFVWVALKDPDDAELAEMKEEFGLHPLAVEDARHGHQRPKIEEYGNSLFAVLHSIEMRDGELHQGEIDIFVGPNYILSVRQRTEQGFAAVRARTENEPELLRHGSGFVFYALVDAIVDRYFPIEDALEVELEQLEGRIFAGHSPRANLEALYGLKQKLTLVNHAIDPLLESIGKLAGGRVPQVCQGTQEYFRDVVDHLERLGRGVDTL